MNKTQEFFDKVQAAPSRQRRVSGREAEFSRRVSNVLLSDKILDDNFCNKAWLKILDQYAEEVERNIRIFLNELEKLKKYEQSYL